MTVTRTLCSVLVLISSAASGFAQAPAPPPPPPPLWDMQVGASFVGTSGNSDTASTGADFSAHRRGLVWQIESAATAVRTNSLGETTAQASMNARLALKIGYLLRYSNDPVPGFKKTDNTTTASVVLRWKASTNAPAP